ncbi:hypothetical protein D3C80_1803300 [compost metagenome]
MNSLPRCAKAFHGHASTNDGKQGESNPVIDRLDILAGNDASEPADQRSNGLDHAEDDAGAHRLLERRTFESCASADGSDEGIDGHADGKRGDGERRH